MKILTSSILRWGNRRGDSPFCWRSRNQPVPCESLVPFFSQERNCQCGRHEPTKAKTFLKFWFEAECILPPAPNGSLHKTKISLWAYAAHSCGYFSFTRKVSKSVSKGTPLRYPRGCAPQWSNDHAPPYSINHHLCAQWFAFCFNSSDLRVLKPEL